MPVWADAVTLLEGLSAIQPHPTNLHPFYPLFSWQKAPTKVGVFCHFLLSAAAGPLALAAGRISLLCKLHKFYIKTLCILTVDFYPKRWYSILVKREWSQWARVMQCKSHSLDWIATIEKNCKFPLDKLQKMCYNKYRKREIQNERRPRTERLKGWEPKSHP